MAIFGLYYPDTATAAGAGKWEPGYPPNVGGSPGFDRPVIQHRMADGSMRSNTVGGSQKRTYHFTMTGTWTLFEAYRSFCATALGQSFQMAHVALLGAGTTVTVLLESLGGKPRGLGGEVYEWDIDLVEQ